MATANVHPHIVSRDCAGFLSPCFSDTTVYSTLFISPRFPGLLNFGAVQEIKAEIVLWTAGFVLLTLIINASMLPWLLRITRLNKGENLEFPPVAGKSWVEE